MSKLSREDYAETIKKLIGDRTDDEALEIVQNLTETYDEMENSSSNNSEWERKYKENDAQWREKYKNAFYTSPKPKDTGDSVEEDDEEVEKKYTFESLFKEGE